MSTIVGDAPLGVPLLLQPRDVNLSVGVHAKTEIFN